MAANIAYTTVFNTIIGNQILSHLTQTEIMMRAMCEKLFPDTVDSLHKEAKENQKRIKDLIADVTNSLFHRYISKFVKKLSFNLLAISLLCMF